jgi:hypothetical protein
LFCALSNVYFGGNYLFLLYKRGKTNKFEIQFDTHQIITKLIFQCIKKKKIILLLSLISEGKYGNIILQNLFCVLCVHTRTHKHQTNPFRRSCVYPVICEIYAGSLATGTAIHAGQILGELPENGRSPGPHTLMIGRGTTILTS